ncbi:MAG: hypothetical protein KGN76_18170 [Acidobacteriota bacterium]|nr:hypothetical protein [Acidobacteriota bacterium]
MARMIVRRGCLDTFERLRRMFVEDPEIEVVWDRRVGDRRAGERRRGSRPGSRDRRQSDRRTIPPQSWLALDFLVARD